MKELFLGAFFTACFSAFIDYCMLKGEIFGFYRPWMYRVLECRFKFLIKPLGDCVICMNVWLSVISFLFTGLSIVWLIPYISISYVFLQIISNFEQ